jgi:hypothetical protein
VVVGGCVLMSRLAFAGVFLLDLSLNDSLF